MHLATTSYHGGKPDLITIYQMVDPKGYEKEIQSAITYLENDGSPNAYIDARYMLQANKIHLALEHNSLDEATHLTLAAQSWLDADSNPHTAGHYRVDFTAYPALIAFKKQAWTELATAAEVAEEAARRRNFHGRLANALMWQALAARNADDKKRAGRLFRAAQGQRSKLGRPPDSWYYQAWASYQELAGSLTDVLQIRREELSDIQNRGMLAYECWVLTELCRLKTVLGIFQPEDRVAAHDAALRLRKPESYFAALESALMGKSTTT